MGDNGIQIITNALERLDGKIDGIQRDVTDIKASYKADMLTMEIKVNQCLNERDKAFSETFVSCDAFPLYWRDEYKKKCKSDRETITSWQVITKHFIDIGKVIFIMLATLYAYSKGIIAF